MGACDTCVGCGIEVAPNGALKVDLQTGGGIVCDLTDPTVNDQISGLYLNVDGTSVTTKPDGVVRAQLGQSGMRRSSLGLGAASMNVPSDSALYPVNALGNLNTIEYDVLNGIARLAGAGYANLTTSTLFATIPVGGAGLYEWEFHARVPTPAANQNPFVLIIRFTVTDPNGSGSYIVDRVGYWGNPFASIGPWPLGDGATIEVGLINPTGQVAITVDTFAFVIAKVGS